jgi:NAD(P)-dependent dehydrogenase (short-subunit alcohol dehydrogenase family)
MNRLQGKIAIVTGTTSGIGKRTAEMFHAEGAVVIMGARREKEGRALEAALGARAHFLPADVTKEADVKALVDFAVSKYGRLDVIFNNAGGPAPIGGIAGIPIEGVERAMAVLFTSVLLGMKHAAPVMTRQRSGSIISNGSVAGLRAGLSSSMVYSAAKAAVIHFTRCVAMELGPHNVRVNTVSPGGIATGIFGKALGLDVEAAEKTADMVKQGLAQMQPIPRAGLVDDIASAALFLASDESSFINGHDLVVDGGVIGGRPWAQLTAALDGMRGAFGIKKG